MSSASSSDVKLEIGHVLFIDIVGYSKLLINEQSEQMQKLREIVRGTEQFRLAEAEGKLLRLPTGDGGALVFRTSVDAPVLCALEISKELKKHPELRVRMGIHSGPVNEITDLNEQANIAGAGINIAQRVMDCGDSGHILLSKHAADDLEQYRQWQPQLHDLGECEVKHGVRVHAVNLYTDELGNSEVPEKFKRPDGAAAAKEARPKSTIRKWAMIGAVVVAVAIIGLLFWWKRTATISAAPEKSIAVLPFENLSEDKANAYFADGIQDEILTRLSKIADLKVISRTSTQHYIPRLKEILADPQPALGYWNGHLRFLLGWAQEVAGDHAAARGSWQQAHSELESFLKEQPENWVLIGDLALTNMGLGDKTAAFALTERATAVMPLEKDSLAGSQPIEILARVSAQLGEPDRAIAALQKLLSIPASGRLTGNAPLTSALLRLDPMFDPLRNDPRFQKLCEEAPK